MNKRKLLITTLALAGALAAAAPARADVLPTIGAGVFFPNDGDTVGGLTATLPLSGVPGIPVQPQISGALPLGNGGRYAITFEGQANLSAGFVGVGIGAGKMDRFGQSGLIFDAFGGVRVAPFTSAVLRFYGAGSNDVGSSTFLGLQFKV